MTDQQEQDELDRNLTSREWRLSNLYWIQNEKGKKVIFTPNAVQRQFDRFMWWLNIVLKSRQHGITTFACIRGLDMAIFKAGSRIGIVAHTREDAGKFFRDKVLYAYDKLDPYVKSLAGIVRRDMNGTLELDNGSIIEVSVSHRGGTFQYLHISEYGPMCALYPQRAAEVKAGALNTVHEGGIVTVESTAYGREGDFFDRSQRAMKLDQMVKAGKSELTRMDYRFFFFAWYHDPKNTLSAHDARLVTITAKMKDYLDGIEDQMDVTLTPGQRAWYTKKDEDQGDKMNQEHPSTPEEAFAASREGSYYSKELSKTRKEGRVCKVPIVPSVLVNTFWDLGRNDANAIWLHQRIGIENRFIGYYENSGRDLSHYAKWLLDYKNEHDIAFGEHYLPHDVEVTELCQVDDKSRQDVLEDLGVKPIIKVPRIEVLAEGIDAVRRVFPTCWFDSEECELGLKRLEQYQKKWNTQVQSYQDSPVKNDARNGADAFRQFAQGYDEPIRIKPKRASRRGWKTS